MAVRGSPEFLDYFARELQYLRESGAEFAKSYPKIAARLSIAGEHCGDPHVERLIESFAYLTAKLQLHIDSELPELTSSLLGVLYPQYSSPVPSMAIASMAPGDPTFTSSATIPKHTPLFAESQGGPICRWRTCMPVTLWPISVKSAEVVAPETLDLERSYKAVAAIRIRLRLTVDDFSFRKLAEQGSDPADRLRSLRFYLSGSGVATARLYDLLFAHTTRLLVARQTTRPGTTDKVTEILHETLPRAVGFADDEEALPFPEHAHVGHRVLQEYFAFPERFYFFDVDLKNLPDSSAIDLIILLDQRPPSSVSVRADTFQLGCTPIINLFPKISEPIRVDHRRSEYHLVADSRRERTTEIHSIQKVTSASIPDPKAIDYEPFFSFVHRSQGDEPTAFWHARRLPSARSDIPGTEVFLSFVNLDFKPVKPPSEAVYASVLCTNRDLSEEITAGVPLQFERAAPSATVTCITKPTRQQHVPLGGQALWRLVSNLSLNHLSLAEGETGLTALREILRSHVFAPLPQAHRQLAALIGLRCRTVQKRVGDSAWRGYCRGTEVSVTVNEEQLSGASAVLFGSVLSRFLGLYAHINSFTELVLYSNTRPEEWKRWPPMAGEKALL